MEGGPVLCFAAAGVDIFGATPTKGDAIDPLDAGDPERVNGQVVYVVSQEKFILDDARFACIFGGEKDDGICFTDSVAQGRLPVGSARCKVGLIDPDSDAASLQIGDEALSE